MSSTRTVQAAFTAITTGFRSGQPNDFPQIVQQQKIMGDRVGSRAASTIGKGCSTTFIRAMWAMPRVAVTAKASVVAV